MSGTRIDYGGLRDLMEEHRRGEKDRRERKGGLVRFLRRIAVGVAALAALAVLPFLLLVQAGVHAAVAGFGPWGSVAAATGAVAVLLALYAWIAGRFLGAGPGTRIMLRRVAVGGAVAFVAYSLAFLGAGRAAAPEVRSEYTELHPVLRLAASTVFLFDPGRVMTDASRTREDYWLMGLPVQEASLHYVQEESGYVHAIDLRTRDRAEWSNTLTEMAFWAMGFHSLRHVGTADHLHVSLRLPG